MPVEVPSESKVYTTVYDNFKGIDLTNDITNVWKRRSPNAKNMLPDLDGKPYKRKGWDIELTPDDFRSAAGIRTEVDIIPDRVYYFELGGYDYMMIFNNLGIFSYSVNPLENSPFKRLLVHHSRYMTAENPHLVDLPGNIDSRKAFFFEGGGTAGFYVFAGTQLFRYDGAYFVETKPYVPLVLIGCEPNGAGTDLEPINMLTPERIIQYSCAHTQTTTYDESGEAITTDTGPTSFIVPGGFSSAPTVKVRDSETGAWTDATGYTAANGKIDFEEAPAEVIKGEDNMQVIYTPDGSGATVVETMVDRDEKTITITREYQQKRTKKGGSPTGVTWQTQTGTVVNRYTGVSFDVSNIKTNEQTKSREFTAYIRNAYNNGWEVLTEQYASMPFYAYKDSVGINPIEALYNSTYYAEKEDQYGKATEKINKHGSKKKANWDYTQTRTVVHKRTYRVKLTYSAYQYNSGSTQSVNEAVTAFSQCSRALVFGSGIINQVFLSSTPYAEYNTRMWYSYATDPTYWPDTNYIEVGATDTPIMGMMKVGEYLGVIKKGTSFDTSIYLAYPTSFDNDTTYAVKQNINGIGAISAGAFNTLNEEPLFLSEAGIMGVEVSEEDTDRQLRNRSHFINKKLCAEPNLESAISFVYEGMYYLAVNNHCYVLDGSQKNSWANEKTNLQYEAYYLENVPAQCFARFEDELWFTDFKGNLCRFRSDTDSTPYRDNYSTEDPVWVSSAAPASDAISVQSLTGDSDAPKAGDTVKHGDDWYTITAVDGSSVTVTNGVAIDAVWATISDDDGAVHFFKNLQKKGCVVSLMPSSDSGVKVYLKQDNKDPLLIGETDAKSEIIPSDYYIKKKIKKYKRLQIICENDVIDDSFGVDQIIKSYTMGNYSKNKG